MTTKTLQTFFISLCFLLLPFSAFAGYSLNQTSSTSGKSFWGDGVLKISASLNGSELTLSVEKIDGGKFTSSGLMYFNKGENSDVPESDRPKIGEKSVVADVSQKLEFTYNLNGKISSGSSLSFHAWYQIPNDTWATVDGITVSYTQDPPSTVSADPQDPVITIQTSPAYKKENVSVDVQVTKEPNGFASTLFCRDDSGNSNYTASSAFSKANIIATETVTIDFIFDYTGSEKIVCSVHSANDDGDIEKSSVITKSLSITEPTTPTNGSCGTANGKEYPYIETSYSSDTQCSVGSASNTAFPNEGQTVTWVCSGSNGGSDSEQCSASLQRSPAFFKIVENLPACKTENGSCIAINANATSTLKLNFDGSTVKKIGVDWEGDGVIDSAVNTTTSSTESFIYPEEKGSHLNASTWFERFTWKAIAYDEDNNELGNISGDYQIYDSRHWRTLKDQKDVIDAKVKKLKEDREPYAETQEAYDNKVKLCSSILSPALDNNLITHDPRDPNNPFKNCSIDKKSVFSKINETGSYEIHFQYNAYGSSSLDSCQNYPARITTQVTKDGSLDSKEYIVNNYSDKEALKIFLISSFDKEINSPAGIYTHNSCKEYPSGLGETIHEKTLSEWREYVESFEEVDEAVAKYAALNGVAPNRNIRQGIVDGTAKALKEIVDSYKDLLDVDPEKAVKSILSSMWGFIQHPVDTTNKAIAVAQEIGSFAEQTAAQIIEVVPLLPDALADLTSYEKAKFSAYVGVLLVHELSPTAKLKLLKVVQSGGKLKTPQWLINALISVRLHKEKLGVCSISNRLSKRLLKPVACNVEVYLGFDPNTGKLIYTGVTNNHSRRQAAHHKEKKGLKIKAIKGLENLSKADAKACEQVLMYKYIIGKKDKDSGQLFWNMINSIAKSNPIHDDAIIRGNELLKSVKFDFDKYLED